MNIPDHRKFLADARAREEALTNRYRLAMETADPVERAIKAGRVLIEAKAERGTSYRFWRKGVGASYQVQWEQRKLAVFADRHGELLDEWRACGVERLKVIAHFSQERLLMLRENTALLSLPPKELSKAISQRPAAGGQKAHGFGMRADHFHNDSNEYLAFLVERNETIRPALAEKLGALVETLQTILSRTP